MSTFVAHAVKAIIASEQGIANLAIAEKTKAMESMEIQKSEFANRPKVGLVDKEKLRDIIEILEGIKHNYS